MASLGPLARLELFYAPVSFFSVETKHDVVCACSNVLVVGLLSSLVLFIGNVKYCPGYSFDVEPYVVIMM